MGPPSLGTVTVVFATIDSFPWSTVEPMERVFFTGPGGPSMNCRLLERLFSLFFSLKSLPRKNPNPAIRQSCQN